MNPILTSITEHATTIILSLYVLSLVTTILAIRASRDAASVKRRFRDLLDGARGENLETLLHNHLSERLRMEDEFKDLVDRTKDLEAKMRRTKRHVGVVRYDAFEDVGGEQSFALAIYDDNGDGALLTSLVGRTDCRVYCKSLEGGSSDRSLSGEEQRAMEAAVERPKARRT